MSNGSPRRTVPSRGTKKGSTRNNLNGKREALEKQLKELEDATEGQIQEAIADAKAKNYDKIKAEIDGIEMANELERRQKKDAYLRETDNILAEETSRMQAEVFERVRNDVDKKLLSLEEQNVELEVDVRELHKKIAVGMSEIQRMNRWKEIQLAEAEKAQNVVAKMKKQIGKGKKAYEDMVQFKLVCKYQAVHFFMLDFKVRSGLAELLEDHLEFCKTLASSPALKAITYKSLEDALNEFMEKAEDILKAVRAFRHNGRSAYRKGMQKPTAAQMLEALMMAQDFLKNFTNGLSNGVHAMEVAAGTFFESNNTWTSKAVHTEEKLRKLTTSRDEMTDELYHLRADLKHKELKQHANERARDRLLKSKGVRLEDTHGTDLDSGCYKDMVAKYVQAGKKSELKVRDPNPRVKKKRNDISLIRDVFVKTKRPFVRKKRPQSARAAEPSNTTQYYRRAPEPPKTQFPLRGTMNKKKAEKAKKAFSF